MAASTLDVRFTPESGHVQRTSREVRLVPIADIPPFTLDWTRLSAPYWQLLRGSLQYGTLVQLKTPGFVVSMVRRSHSAGALSNPAR